LTGWEESIVDADPGIPGRQEIKEWIALAEYLQSFSPSSPGSAPAIPGRYMASAGRFFPQPSLNPVDLVRRPNRYSLFVAGMSLVILLFATITVSRVKKRKRSPRTT
jgi:hypothetical protein